MMWQNTTSHQSLEDHYLNPWRRRWQSFSWSRNSAPFVKLEMSLPCSQQPATGSYPDPDEYSPRLTLLL